MNKDVGVQDPQVLAPGFGNMLVNVAVSASERSKKEGTEIKLQDWSRVDKSDFKETTTGWWGEASYCLNCNSIDHDHEHEVRLKPAVQGASYFEESFN